MEQDRTWNLFALKLAGKATAEDWAELQLLMEAKPEIAVHLQALTNFWHQHSGYDRERIEKAVRRIAMNYQEQSKATNENARTEQITAYKNHPVEPVIQYQTGVLFQLKKFFRGLLGWFHSRHVNI